VWPFRPRSASSRGAAPDGGPPGDQAGQRGRHGEQLARSFLRQLGLKVLAANYRCPAGEVDLIALDASTHKTLDCDTLVFVEVKTRSPGQLTSPESAVDDAKRNQMRKVARYYQSARSAHDLAVRFDVIAIVLDPAGQAEIKHIPGAF